MSLPNYAELHCLSNFSFLRGASHPDELVTQAAAQGYTALALTDECSLAGIVRAHLAARKQGIQLLVGSEMRVDRGDEILPAVDGIKLVFLARNREGYGNLSALSQLLPVWRWPGLRCPERDAMRNRLAASGSWRGGLFLAGGLAFLGEFERLAFPLTGCAMLLFAFALVQALSAPVTTTR